MVPVTFPFWGFFRRLQYLEVYLSISIKYYSYPFSLKFQYPSILYQILTYLIMNF